MDTVTRFIDRPGTALATATASSAEAARTLSATASFLLSEAGRKASLIAGGDGRAQQHLTLQVPANRLHLVSVDAEGVARLKLRPRFDLDGTAIARIDTPPVYDAPPSIEDLYRAAARNHELEAAYYTQRVAVRTQRADDDRARRQAVAEMFLADRTMRAAPHPPPTAKVCYVVTNRGGVRFDVSIDQGLAKDVPPEAQRRFRADLRADQERVAQEKVAQATLHAEKRAWLEDWLRMHGAAEERARHAAGLLSMADASARLTDDAFAALDARPVYVRDGASRLERHIRQHTGATHVVVTPADLVVRSAHAVAASAEHWAALRDIQARLPEAHTVLRHHALSSRRHPGVPNLVIIGVLVTLKQGPFLLRREYVVSDGSSATEPASGIDHR